MNIAKALKLKNRLAGEIARLKTIVQTKNSNEKDQDIVYDVRTILTKTLPDAVKNLVKVKTAIACSNALAATNADDASLTRYPYWHIFMLAEAKGMIEMLKVIDTKNGKQNGSFFRSLGGESVPVEYVAQVKQQEVDALIAHYEKLIDDTQDLLDTHNATANLAVLDGISVK